MVRSPWVLHSRVHCLRCCIYVCYTCVWTCMHSPECSFFFLSSGTTEIQYRLRGDFWTAGGANSNAGPAQISQRLHASDSHHRIRGEPSLFWLIRAWSAWMTVLFWKKKNPSLNCVQGDICELGRVLMQGSFSVWISHKRGPTRMKELARFKPMQRHLFLYERALLLCKRREEHGDGCEKTPSYSFKHCLKVGLCLWSVLKE